MTGQHRPYRRAASLAMAESPLHTDRAAVLVMMDQADALWGIHGLLMDLEAAVRRIHQ